MSKTRYFDDFEIGQVWTSREEEMTQEAIIAYARLYDPQPMHMDPDYASTARFGTIIASGWQIAALALRLFIESGGYGKTPVIGLGSDELRWHAVVRPGDVLHSRREIIEVRKSKSKPDRGIIRTKIDMINQNDVTVMSMISAGQVPTQEKQL